MSEAKRGPPQQLSSWQSAYSKRLDALGFFDSSERGRYEYPSELVRKCVEPSSDEEDAVWDPERDEDGSDEVDDDEADETAGEVEEELARVVPQVHDLER